MLHGGEVSGRASGYDETWWWNGEAWAQFIGSGPGDRAKHTMVYDANRRVMVLVGGRWEEGIFDAATWEFDGAQWQYRHAQAGDPRYEHGMAFDSWRRVCVVFGNEFTNPQSTWEWDGFTWVLRSTTGPSYRARAPLAFDERRGVTVLFGGVWTQPLADTWEWNGIAWTQRDVQGPPRRHSHAMVYDSHRQRIVLAGGIVTHELSTLGDTWEWDGTTWTELPTQIPPRAGHSMAYDPVRQEVVLFGSKSDYWSESDVWVLRPAVASPVVVTQPRDASACPGGTATFTLVADAGIRASYQWRHNGRVLVDAPSRVSGANSATLAVIGASALDEGIYDCIITNNRGIVTTEPRSFTLCDHPADLTCDGQVGLADLAVLLSNFGSDEIPGRENGDLDRNGAVDLEDLALMLRDFGTPCP